VRRGLEQVGGNYRALVPLLGMNGDDYKRFLNFLSAHECGLPRYRTARAAMESEGLRRRVAEYGRASPFLRRDVGQPPPPSEGAAPIGSRQRSPLEPSEHDERFGRDLVGRHRLDEHGVRRRLACGGDGSSIDNEKAAEAGHRRRVTETAAQRAAIGFIEGDDREIGPHRRGVIDRRRGTSREHDGQLARAHQRVRVSIGSRRVLDDDQHHG